MLTIFAAIGLALGVSYYGQQLLYLPPPDKATDEQLFKWLVLRDIETESPEVQTQLVDRFAKMRELPNMATEGSVSLTENQRTRILDNATVLRKRWFVERAVQYQSLEESKRWAFLTAQLETIDYWSDVVYRYSDELGLGDTSIEGWIAEVDRWIVESSAEEQTALNTVLCDGTMCWLATRDLGQQESDVQQSMARRISIQLDQGIDLSSASSQLSDEEHRQFMANCEVLMKAFIFEQVEAFRHVPATEQFAFVDEQLRRVNAWGVLELIGGGKQKGFLAKASGALRMKSMFREWIKQADENDRVVMNDLYQVVVNRLPVVLAD